MVVNIEADVFRLLPIAMAPGEGNAAPHLVASFDTRFLYQTSPSTGALNTLFLTLKCNARLGAETLVTLNTKLSTPNPTP